MQNVGAKKWPKAKVRIPFHPIQNKRATPGDSVFTGQMRLTAKGDR